MRHFMLLAMAPLLLAAQGKAPEAVPELGAQLERFDYPWPVQRMAVPEANGASMAFMDVTPKRPNGQTVVLLHGKNFCGATWESSARALSAAGYRVLIPDQIGFCKSSKPAQLQYSFPLLASLTERMLRERGVTKATIVGHSMGGMLAMRFAIQYPDRVAKLVLVNPLGLVDRLAEGVPYTPVSSFLADEQKTSAATIKAYQLNTYYHGNWRSEYDRWVAMQAGMYAGAGRAVVAPAQAKLSEMILSQPVAYELHRVTAPTTLVIGPLDKTVFGKAKAPKSLQEFLKPIPDIADAAAAKMRRAKVVRMEGLGHSPQVEAPERFERLLLEEVRPPRS